VKGLEDTDPQIERMQLDLLRQMGPDRLMSFGLRLSDKVIRASRRAFLEKYDDERRAKIEWVRAFYGEDLARGLEARLRDA
jgi:hypothetical protein